ncbi:hypothetical protein F4559_000739 [Saccharothrix violaceirubra]|uniref:Uncharacterized protein n=1 Tax=Saccharothrix violaceirubra TaxID=413306 RepID=A0A7W7WTP1_9PSEU|nr:hypothetical protein [Saccharothrix violaceirubra]
MGVLRCREWARSSVGSVVGGADRVVGCRLRRPWRGRVRGIGSSGGCACRWIARCPAARGEWRAPRGPRPRLRAGRVRERASCAFRHREMCVQALSFGWPTVVAVGVRSRKAGHDGGRGRLCAEWWPVPPDRRKPFRRPGVGPGTAYPPTCAGGGAGGVGGPLPGLACPAPRVTGHGRVVRGRRSGLPVLDRSACGVVGRLRVCPPARGSGPCGGSVSVFRTVVACRSERVPVPLDAPMWFSSPLRPRH